MSDDPRDPTLEVTISKPPTWAEESDTITTISMLLAGTTMVTRNRLMAWPGLGIALSGWVNQHPLRAKDSVPGIGPILFALGALTTAYMPLVVLQHVPNQVQTPLSV